MAMYEERCLHSDVCKYGKNRTNGMYCTGERCLHFIDRTKLADGVKTNADRIRAMSDEELAAYLVYHNPYSTEEFCLKWLRQPVKDGEGDG